MNNISLIGRISKPLEVSRGQSGNTYCNFSIAVNKPKKNGEEQKANFFNCVCFGNIANNLSLYCGKGSQIAITGSLENNHNEKDGVKYYSEKIICHNIEYLDTKKPNQSNNIAQPQASATSSFFESYSQGSSDVLAGLDISDDDLPF